MRGVPGNWLGVAKCTSTINTAFIYTVNTAFIYTATPKQGRTTRHHVFDTHSTHLKTLKQN